MSTLLGIVLPGTNVSRIVKKILLEKNPNAMPEDLPTIKLGDGIMQTSQNTLVTVKAGILCWRRPNKFFVDSRPKAYVPTINDLIVGIVVARVSDGYKVDIGGANMATLPFTGFLATTKKNRPNMEVGDLLFARVLTCSRDIDPELACFDLDGKNEMDTMGPIAQVPCMMMFECSSFFSKTLQLEDCPLLALIGEYFAFEVIVGANGRFVVITKNVQDTAVIGSIILGQQNSNLEREHVLKMIREHVSNKITK